MAGRRLPSDPEYLLSVMAELGKSWKARMTPMVGSKTMANEQHHPSTTRNCGTPALPLARTYGGSS